MKPLAIDLYCGLGGWSESLLAEGYEVVGFDIEQHVYGEHRYPAQLVLQDVRTIHGRQFKDAALIVCSPPCQEFSYMAMPWTRAKQIRRALRGEGDFPEGYTGSRTVAELTALFDACFRIQAEASDAAGRHIPLIVENVRGAQEWVGRERWRFGSFYLWGDVPALMPMTGWREVMKRGIAHRSDGSTNFHQGKYTKNAGGSWFNIAHNTTSGVGRNPVHELNERGVKSFTPQGQPLGQNEAARKYGSQSPQRKMASAMIAKIPEPLARHIARVYRP